MQDADASAAAAVAAAAFAAGFRAVASYDAQHPVSVEHRKQLDAAVRRWQAAVGGTCMLAVADRAVLLTGAAEPVTNDSIRGLCDALVSRSVVAVRLRAPINGRDVDELLAALAETDHRVRAAGGIAQMLRGRGVQTIDVVEMDLEALLAGEPLNAAGMEPMVGEALVALLGAKQAERRVGSVVSISLERVTSVGSLGSVLDELWRRRRACARRPGRCAA